MSATEIQTQTTQVATPQPQPTQTARPRGPAHTPRVDIVETDGDFKVLVELPGVLSADVSVQLDRRQLTVEATRFLGPATPEGERPSRFYRRAFTVPDSVNPNAITAALDAGILTVTLGKRAESRARAIEVQ